MKYYLLCIVLFLGGKAWSQAPNPYWSNQIFRAGPIIGLNFSQVDGDTDGGIHKLGLHVGLGSYVSMSEKIGFQLDILYSQKGSRYVREMSSTAGPYFMTYKLKLNYVEIPLALQYYVTPDIHIGLGGSYNRLINTDEKWLGLYGWSPINADEYPFNANVWEGFVSASYRLTDGIRAEVRYQRSITPLRDVANTHQNFSNGRDQINNLLSLRIGIYL